MSDFITYDSNLYKLLGLNKDRRYKVNNIKIIMDSKKLYARDINHYFPCIKCCSCGQCSINHERLLKYIEENFVGSIPKNISHYYEYTQEPVQITNMTFE